jgi:hypothetical protein
MTIVSNTIKLLIACTCLLCGCAGEHFARGRGDVGAFIVHQAIIRGGQPITTNNLPVVLTGGWKSFEDDKGVVIRMKRQDCAAVKLLLRQAFGDPSHGPTKTDEGREWGAYRLTTKGGSIQFACFDDQTQITIIRVLSKEEFADSLKHTLQDKEVQKEMIKDQNQTP